MSYRFPGAIVKRAPTIFVLGLLLFSVLHIYGVSCPPNGYHQWRESDTSAIILNYYQEDHSFLEPRMNQRGDGTGITGMELPLYQYAAMLLYFVTGPSHAACRLLTLLGALVAAMSLFGLVRRLCDDLTAAISGWALLFSPLFLFYSSKIMPDIWMLCFLLLAAYTYVRYLKSNLPLWWIVSALCLTCSATIKPLGLCLYLPLLALSWRRKPVWSSIGRFALYAAITFGATLAWFLYARSVSATHGGGAFDLGDNLAQSWRAVAAPDFLNHLLLQWPWELWIGYALVPLFAVGIFQAIRNSQFRFFGWWLLGALLVFAILAGNASTHDYYTLVILPPLAVLTGLGGAWFLTYPRRLRIVGLIFILAAPVAASARIVHRINDVPEFDAIRKEADLHIPVTSLVAVEDATESVRLYQLNRHGWSIRYGVTYDHLKPVIDRGATYVILDNHLSTYADSVRMLLDTTGIPIGPFKAYRPASQAEATP